MHTLMESYLKAVYRILHYLKGTPGEGVLFKKGEAMLLEVYTDADYAGSMVDRRSTSGYCTLLRGLRIIQFNMIEQSMLKRIDIL